MPDPPEPDNAEGLHSEPPDQLAFDRPPRRRRILPLPLVIKDHAAAQRQGQRHRMIGNLGCAVIRHIADEDIACCRGRPRDFVVADPHPHYRAQTRKPANILRGDRIEHDHEPVDLRTVGGVEVGEVFDLAPYEADLGPEDPGFETVVRDLPFLGVKHRNRHYVTFTGWWSAAERTIASKAATPCSTSPAVMG